MPTPLQGSQASDFIKCDHVHSSGCMKDFDCPCETQHVCMNSSDDTKAEQSRQDEIQESTMSLEEKLEALDQHDCHSSLESGCECGKSVRGHFNEIVKQVGEMDKLINQPI